MNRIEAISGAHCGNCKNWWKQGGAHEPNKGVCIADADKIITGKVAVCGKWEDGK